MTDFLVVLTATNSKDEAQTIAHALVSKRLASSVNVKYSRLKAGGL